MLGDVALPAALVPASALSRLSALAAAVPPLYSSFGFEVRLRGGGPVDLGVPITRSEAAGLVRWVADRQWDSADRAGWRRIGRFARTWASDELVRRWVPFAFLEYDAEGQLVPSIFAALDTPLTMRQRWRRSVGPAVVGAVLEPLLGRSRAAAIGHGVGHCLEHLPSDARPLHLGVMLSRDGAPVRLSLAIAPDALPGYFATLGAAEAAMTAERALETLEPLYRAAGELGASQVDFDVGFAGAPALGLAVRPTTDTGWDRLLAALVERNLCTAPRARAARRWHDRRAQAEGHGATCFLSHVKLTTVGRGSRAKLYFGVSFAAAD